MINQPFFVLLNAPPRSGKDYLAEHLCKEHGFVKLSLAHRLKLKVLRLYGVSHYGLEYFEARKDTPLTELHGLSFRQACIGLAQNYFKPLHGVDFFARLLIQDIDTYYCHQGNQFVISDVGFNEEVEALAESFGVESLLLVRIKSNADWSNDARYNLSYRGVEELHVANNYDEQFLETASSKLMYHLEKYRQPITP